MKPQGRYSAETRAKIGATMRRHWADPEWRARTLAAIRSRGPFDTYGEKAEGWIPATPIREAVERSEMTASEICRQLGWLRNHNGSPDSTRLNRALGRSLFSGHGGYGRGKAKMLHYQTAIAILRAIDRDPVDFDL